ncbi:MAG: DUF4124 domain-containing protein [Proteobacteria bacterium]|nr:DUF4124 domain-containing protein [Pseudomonadota bacterium]
MAQREPRANAKRVWLACLAAAAVLALPVPAGAAICKYLDADGNIVYSNVAPAKGLRKLSCDIVEESPRRSPDRGAGTASPADFPRVAPDVQKSRDDTRRRILDDELAKEQKLLAAAQQEYGNGAPQPLADEKSDAEKYRERIERLRQAVVLHQRNIDALRKEIAATR